MHYNESNIANIVGYSKGLSYSKFKEAQVNHEWNAVKINNQWCLIDSTWGTGNKFNDYLCTPPHCFIRDHLPQESQTEFQFLEEIIDVKQFQDIAEVFGVFVNIMLKLLKIKVY